MAAVAFASPSLERRDDLSFMPQDGVDAVSAAAVSPVAEAEAAYDVTAVDTVAEEVAEPKQNEAAAATLPPPPPPLPLPPPGIVAAGSEAPAAEKPAALPPP